LQPPARIPYSAPRPLAGFKGTALQLGSKGEWTGNRKGKGRTGERREEKEGRKYPRNKFLVTALAGYPWVNSAR